MRRHSFAVIFDMDGVVVDNTKYHALAWKTFAKKRGKTITTKEVKEKVLGLFNKEIFEWFFGCTLTTERIQRFADEKEALYRKVYAPAIRPLPGLHAFLEKLKAHHVRVGLATAAPPINVRWVLRKTGLARYFRTIVDDTGVARGKPHPDIFLKCAKRLGVTPRHCVVFEDAMSGITAARRAGMKVVGVATTHKPNELRHTDLVVRDFRKLTLDRLQKLFD